VSLDPPQSIVAEEEMVAATSTIMCQIIVRHLPYFCDDQQLFDLFNEYAYVLSTQVIRRNQPQMEDNTDPVHQQRETRHIIEDASVGIVTVSSPRQVEELFWLLNGQLFLGRNIR
jgi:hypothetical protein